MSIEYTMRAVCDKCGNEIEPTAKVAKGDIDSKRWGWERKWSNDGIMYGLRSLYGKRKLYCAKCADGK